jgi:hypothetical protein
MHTKQHPVVLLSTTGCAGQIAGAEGEQRSFATAYSGVCRTYAAVQNRAVIPPGGRAALGEQTAARGLDVRLRPPADLCREVEVTAAVGSVEEEYLDRWDRVVDTPHPPRCDRDEAVHGVPVELGEWT